MKLYVGNLSWEAKEDELNQLFAAHGNVVSASIITDRETGRCKGFGFVEMSNKDEAEAAIKALNDTEMRGRNIKVNEARPREERPSRRAW